MAADKNECNLSHQKFLDRPDLALLVRLKGVDLVMQLADLRQGQLDVFALEGVL